MDTIPHTGADPFFSFDTTDESDEARAAMQAIFLEEPPPAAPEAFWQSPSPHVDEALPATPEPVAVTIAANDANEPQAPSLVRRPQWTWLAAAALGLVCAASGFVWGARSMHPAVDVVARLTSDVPRLTLAEPAQLAFSVSGPARVDLQTPVASGPLAAELKQMARDHLEQGRPRDALAAARRARAIDARDAETWLLVGATEQALGHARAAQQTFAACARVAKRGAVGECRALTWGESAR